MEVPSLFSGKRDFATSVYESSRAKRVKHNPESPMFSQSEPPAWTWPPANANTVDNDESPNSKRSLEEFFARAAKRFKQDPCFESTVVSEEETSLDSDCSILEMEDLELEEARSQLLQNDDIMDRVMGFMDSVSLERCRGVNKKWKNSCEHALERRQLADPSQKFSWNEFPRLVFDARFRVNGGGPLDYYPRAWYDGSLPKQDMQIEISGFSWQGSQTRSVNLMDPHSNRVVKLITQTLTATMAGTTT